jgi:D-glycero-alpha-D-manno-heptose 1-phosphate guanylyltransferase
VEAVILAGGAGTRLSHIVKDVPKPMADVNGKPFLEYIVQYLIRKNVNKIILAVGYKYEKIVERFGDEYNGVSIVYSIEDSPLGTGGALKKASVLCESDSFFLINGDTYFNVDLAEMWRMHIKTQAALTVACKPMRNFDRYGNVAIDENSKIIAFEEKRFTESGIINGGVYLCGKKIFSDMPDGAFSFEKDILEKVDGIFSAFVSDTYFIDIGIPEDYYRAKAEFANIT